METAIATADLAWMLAAFSLVVLMFPGLALYYGGMLGSKNTLNMMMMVLSTLGITAIVYTLIGYGLVSGPSIGGIIGNPSEFIGGNIFLTDTGSGGVEGAFDHAFFILFAAITIAIAASGAASRMKFSSWLVLAPLWLILVYFPVAHWVFNPDGWLASVVQIHDYAGGTAVHMNAGVAALAIAVVLGVRRNRGERPHNLPLVMLGGGILWFGWFGFNGGTAGAADFLAQYVVMTTLLSGCAGMIGFAIVERIMHGRVTMLGLVTGIIAALVGITPSADSVSPLGALAVGLLASGIVALALEMKNRLRIDESLDAFAVHGLGGIVGTICIVLFASSAAPGGVAGILAGGSPDIIWRELVGILVTCGYSFIVTWLLATALQKAIGLRVDEETEQGGLDITVHAEHAYDIQAGTAASGAPHSGQAMAIAQESTRRAAESTEEVDAEDSVRV